LHAVRRSYWSHEDPERTLTIVHLASHFPLATAHRGTKTGFLAPNPAVSILIHELPSQQPRPAVCSNAACRPLVGRLDFLHSDCRSCRDKNTECNRAGICHPVCQPLAEWTSGNRACCSGMAVRFISYTSPNLHMASIAEHTRRSCNMSCTTGSDA